MPMTNPSKNIKGSLPLIPILKEQFHQSLMKKHQPTKNENTKKKKDFALILFDGQPVTTGTIRLLGSKAKLFLVLNQKKVTTQNRAFSLHNLFSTTLDICMRNRTPLRNAVFSPSTCT